jgi:hypothetical protein
MPLERFHQLAHTRCPRRPKFLHHDAPGKVAQHRRLLRTRTGRQRAPDIRRHRITSSRDIQQTPPCPAPSPHRHPLPTARRRPEPNDWLRQPSAHSGSIAGLPRPLAGAVPAVSVCHGKPPSRPLPGPGRSPRRQRSHVQIPSDKSVAAGLSGLHALAGPPHLLKRCSGPDRPSDGSVSAPPRRARSSRRSPSPPPRSASCLAAVVIRPTSPPRPTPRVAPPAPLLLRRSRRGDASRSPLRLAAGGGRARPRLAYQSAGSIQAPAGYRTSP